jgi:hypothetical protein
MVDFGEVPLVLQVYLVDAHRVLTLMHRERDVFVDISTIPLLFCLRPVEELAGSPATVRVLGGALQGWRQQLSGLDLRLLWRQLLLWEESRLAGLAELRLHEDG